MNNSFAEKTIEKYGMLEKDDTVVVGLSGGADSVCLLHSLLSLREKYNLTVVAAHINHGIRGDEAKRDEDFCIALCKKLKTDIRVFHADIPELSKQRKLGEEECGRVVRYEFFKSVAGEKGKIATAHNLNDNAETVLLNITRGTGNRGMCGIPAVRDNIIRPLLETSRQEIEQYCMENGLDYVTDSTNLSCDYSRNKIRNGVMPVLREINPSVINAFARLIAASNEDENYFVKAVEGIYPVCVKDDKIIENELSVLDRAIKTRVIALFLKQHTSSDVSSKHIDDVLAIVGTGKTLYTVGAITLRSRNGLIEIVNKQEVNDFEQPVSCSSGTYKIPGATVKIQKTDIKDLQNLNKEVLDNCVDCDKINTTLTLRNRRSGDAVRLARRKVTKTLKKLFNEDGIEPEKRDLISVLASGDEIVWVEGYGASEKYHADKNSDTVILITVVRG